MKETSELVVFLTKVILKTLHTQKDGFQLKDLIEYIEHLKDAPQAFMGLKNVKTEFELANQFDIYGLADQVRRLIADELGANADPLLIETIVSAISSVLLVYARIAKNN